MEVCSNLRSPLQADSAINAEPTELQSARFEAKRKNVEFSNWISEVVSELHYAGNIKLYMEKVRALTKAYRGS